MEPAPQRKPKTARKEKSIRLRLSSREKDLWSRAAHEAGRDLSNWIRFVANRAASKATAE